MEYIRLCHTDMAQTSESWMSALALMAMAQTKLHRSFQSALSAFGSYCPVVYSPITRDFKEQVYR